MILKREDFVNKNFIFYSFKKSIFRPKLS